MGLFPYRFGSRTAKDDPALDRALAANFAKAATEEGVAGLYVPKSIGDNKGDLVGFSAADTPVVVAKAASDGCVLTSDTTQTGGVKWVPPIMGIYGASTTRNCSATAGWIYLPDNLFDTVIGTERTLSGSSHFNTTTGTFTAPVTGTYEFIYRLSTAGVYAGLKGMALFFDGAGPGYPYHFESTYWYRSVVERVPVNAGTAVRPVMYNSAATARSMVGDDAGRVEDCQFSWRLVQV